MDLSPLCMPPLSCCSLAMLSGLPSFLRFSGLFSSLIYVLIEVSAILGTLLCRSSSYMCWLLTSNVAELASRAFRQSKTKFYLNRA